jgi:hypothetical protein
MEHQEYAVLAVLLCRERDHDDRDEVIDDVETTLANEFIAVQKVYALIQHITHHLQYTLLHQQSIIMPVLYRKERIGADAQ